MFYNLLLCNRVLQNLVAWSNHFILLIIWGSGIWGSLSRAVSHWTTWHLLGQLGLEYPLPRCSFTHTSGALVGMAGRLGLAGLPTTVPTWVISSEAASGKLGCFQERSELPERVVPDTRSRSCCFLNVGPENWPSIPSAVFCCPDQPQHMPRFKEQAHTAHLSIGGGSENLQLSLIC